MPSLCLGSAILLQIRWNAFRPINVLHSGIDMLKRLSALFAIVVLLLPSSLAAAVFSSIPLCSGQSAHCCCTQCCCTHDDAAAPQGPALSRGCCCALKAPQVPSEPPSPTRILSDSTSEALLYACSEASLFTFEVNAPAALPMRPKAPPRAPPQPLFLIFQSFLI
jgi:hypothetical protein